MSELSPQMSAVLMLVIAAVGWYAAAHAAEESLSSGNTSPGRRAVAYSLSSLLVVFIAIISGKPEVAVGVIFATSVASLTLVLGICIFSAHHTRATQRRKIWGFILPVSLISLLIGFRGAIAGTQAIMLAIEGMVLLMLWHDVPAIRDASDEAAIAGSGMSDGVLSYTNMKPPPRRRIPFPRGVQIVIALLASGVASWAGVAATNQLAGSIGLANAGLITALMLAPAMILSMIGSGAALSSEGRFDEAVTSLVGYVLIQLCAVLPIAAMLWLGRPVWNPPLQSLVSAIHQEPQVLKPLTTTQPAITASTAPATSQATSTSDDTADTDDSISRPLAYPLATWRVDTVLLVAVGMLLLPVALGRWSIGTIEGAGLILTYVIYMALTTIMSR